VPSLLSISLLSLILKGHFLQTQVSLNARMEILYYVKTRVYVHDKIDKYRIPLQNSVMQHFTKKLVVVTFVV